MANHEGDYSLEINKVFILQIEAELKRGSECMEKIKQIFGRKLHSTFKTPLLNVYFILSKTRMQHRVSST